MSRQPVGEISGNGIDEVGQYFEEFDLDHPDRRSGTGKTKVHVAEDLQVLPPPSAPMEVARELVDRSLHSKPTR